MNTKEYSKMPLIIDDAFLIEDSSSYKSLPEGLRSVEFIRRKENNLVLVEAKETFANPLNIEIKDNQKTAFEIDSDEVTEKFLHSLTLFASIAVGLKSEDITAINNKTSELTQIKLVLIIKNHELDWCKPIKKKLSTLIDEHFYFREIWRPEIFVINYNTAKKYGLAV
jgi:hypothetical protein